MDHYRHNIGTAIAQAGGPDGGGPGLPRRARGAGADQPGTHPPISALIALGRIDEAVERLERAIEARNSAVGL